MKRRLLISILSAAGIVFFGFLFILPRLCDREVPQLFIRHIRENGSYNQNISLEISANEKKGKLKSCLVLFDGEVYFEQQLNQKTWTRELVLFLEGLPEKAYQLECRVTDNAVPPNQARNILPFTYDKTPPELRPSRDTYSIEQGNVLAVYIHVPEEKAVNMSAMFKAKEILFFPLPRWPGVYRGLVPVSALAKAETVLLEITAGDKAGNQTKQVVSVHIRPYNFLRETITLNREKTALLTDAGAAKKNRERLEEVLLVSTSVQLWQGNFIRPVEGWISSRFGTRRVYNNGIVYSYHRGLDLANLQGTPVFAANRGKVVLAEALPLYGNSVVINHGQRVFSFYFHMHTLSVRENQVVGKGEQLGTVGSTGISTGPHLHWEMRVDGISVNPVAWESPEHLLVYVR